MRKICIFNSNNRNLYNQFIKLYGSSVKMVTSIERLAAERLSKEDVIVVSGHSTLSRWIEIRLSTSFAFISFYNPEEQDIKPFTCFGHTVFLPLGASTEDIAEAMKMANEIINVIGTLEDEVIGVSPQMLRLREQIRNMISRKNVSVHLEGESGTGKSMIAQLIHDGRFSKRKKLIRDVASFYRGNLCENRMFGHKIGAFTGADSRRLGIFASANGSEFFMDELQELEPDSQSMMLDVIENGTYRQQGDDVVRKTEFIFMSASNIPIKSLLEANKLRSDLWYRMNSYVISISPLREHPSDIPLLIAHWEYLHQIDVEHSLKDSKAMREREWHGNVRELFKSVERIHNGLEDAEGNQL